jgi:hypothetical protein
MLSFAAVRGRAQVQRLRDAGVPNARLASIRRAATCAFPVPFRMARRFHPAIQVFHTKRTPPRVTGQDVHSAIG